MATRALTSFVHSFRAEAVRANEVNNWSLFLQIDYILELSGTLLLSLAALIASRRRMPRTKLDQICSLGEELQLLECVKVGAKDSLHEGLVLVEAQ